MLAPSRRRVLVVVNDLTPYGSQRVALSLSEVWSRDHDVVIATLEAPTSRDLPLPPSIRRVVLRRRGPRAWALVSLARQVRRLCALEQPDHLMSHMTFSNIITLLGQLGRRPRPVVVEHNILSRNLQVQAGGRVSGALFRLLHPGAAAVVGVSEGVLDDLAEVWRVPRARLVRRYNPVPFRAPANAAPPHPWLADGHRGAVLVCVGGFRRAKGQDLLLEAVGQLARSGDETTQLVLLGEGPLEDQLRRLAADLGIADRVLFAGYRDDAIEWVRRGTALVMPSRWDSFGLVAVEAARVGTPVLAAEVPGLSEVVPRYAPGWLVPPERPDLLASAIASVVAGATPEGASADLDDFDPDVVASQYLTLLEAVRADVRHR